VVGVGRSGTTLLRLMLDAHPELAIPPETGFLLPLFERSADLPALAPCELARLVTGFHTWGDFGLPAAGYERELLRLDPFSLADGVRLFYRLYARRHGKSRWGDKTPVYGRHLPAVRQLLPESRFVHLLRDGRDVALSLRSVWFAPAHDITGLARYWAEQVELSRAAGELLGGYLEVRYEDLVTAPKPTLRSICRFLGLTYDRAMARPHERAPERLREIQDQTLPDGQGRISREQRLAQHPNLLLPPDPRRLGRWRTEMTAAERSEFAGVAGPLLRQLGYET
jgi:hypothetical protein